MFQRCSGGKRCPMPGTERTDPIGSPCEVRPDRIDLLLRRTGGVQDQVGEVLAIRNRTTVSAGFSSGLQASIRSSVTLPGSSSALMRCQPAPSRNTSACRTPATVAPISCRYRFTSSELVLWQTWPTAVPACGQIARDTLFIKLQCNRRFRPCCQRKCRLRCGKRRNRHRVRGPGGDPLNGIDLRTRIGTAGGHGVWG